MQFITIMMITEITSTATYLVLIPAESSSLTDFFNPEPRWGSRYCHPPFMETLPQENQVTFLLMERSWGESLPFVYFPHGTANWKDGNYDANFIAKKAEI